MKGIAQSALDGRHRLERIGEAFELECPLVHRARLPLDTERTVSFADSTFLYAASKFRGEKPGGQRGLDSIQPRCKPFALKVHLLLFRETVVRLGMEWGARVDQYVPGLPPIRAISKKGCPSFDLRE